MVPMAKPRRRLPLPLLLTLTVCAAVATLTLNGLHGQRAPRIAFTLLGTEPVPLEQLAGAPLIVNFWATTCTICRAEMPELADLYRDLRPRGLEMIGVAMPYDPPNLVAEFVQQHSVPYPIALDIDGSVVDAFGGVVATPTTFLISPDGVILRRIEGRLDFRLLRRDVRRLLRQRPPAQPAARSRTVGRQVARLDRT